MPHFVYSFSGHLGWFYLLAITKSAAMNNGHLSWFYLLVITKSAAINNGHLGWFYLLAITKRAAMNMRVQITACSFWDSIQAAISLKDGMKGLYLDDVSDDIGFFMQTVVAVGMDMLWQIWKRGLYNWK